MRELAASGDQQVVVISGDVQAVVILELEGLFDFVAQHGELFGVPTGFHDLGTGSRFDLEGRCVEGSLRGKQLARVPSLLTEWYGWFAHHPETTIYGR